MSLPAPPRTLHDLRNLHGRRADEAVKLLKSDRSVIGLLGPDAPEELAVGAGAHPLRLDTFPRLDDVEPIYHARSEKLLGSAADVPTRDLLASVLSGSLEGLRGILIASTHQSHLWLYQILRELNNENTRIPPVHLVDLKHMHRPSTQRYNSAQLHRAWAVTITWTGANHRPAASSAQDATNLRDQWQTVASIRRQCRLSGGEALRLAQVSEIVGPQDTSRMLTALLPSLQARQPLPLEPLWLAGSRVVEPAILDELASLGWSAVGEDHREDLRAAISEGAGSSATTRDWIEGLARIYGRRRPLSHSSSPRQRAEALLNDLQNHDVDRVLLVQRSGDEAPAWDRQHCVNALQKRGVRFAELRLERDGSAPDGAHGLVQAVAALNQNQQATHE